jgi:hypothetical protein
MRAANTGAIIHPQGAPQTPIAWLDDFHAGTVGSTTIPLAIGTANAAIGDVTIANGPGGEKVLQLGPGQPEVWRMATGAVDCLTAWTIEFSIWVPQATNNGFALFTANQNFREIAMSVNPTDDVSGAATCYILFTGFAGFFIAEGVSTEQWHTVRLTRQGDDVARYLDDVLVGANTASVFEDEPMIPEFGASGVNYNGTIVYVRGFQVLAEVV